MAVIAGALCGFFPLLGQASVLENYRARLHGLKTENSHQIYWQSSVTEYPKDGESLIHNVYYYGAGPDQTAAEEKAHYIGDELVHYLIRHHQLREDWETSIDKDQVHFRKRKWDENTLEEDHEELSENFVVAPMVVPYIQKNWTQVLSGKDLQVRFAVPARKETIGFEISHIGEGHLEEQPVVILKMQPSSFFISLLVDPLIMYLTPDGGALLRLKGRTLPRQLNSSGKWKDMDVDTYFYRHSPKFRQIQRFVGSEH